MKNITKVLFSCVAAFSLAHTASAITDTSITLTLSPVNQTINDTLGQEATYNLVVSGLNGTEDGNSFVTGFNLVLDYNPAVVNLVSDSFSALLGDGINTSLNLDNSTSGVVSLNCTSFGYATAATEGSSFTLGTVTFEGVANGVSALTWDWNADSSVSNTTLSDGTGASNLDIASVTNGSLTVVPEPSTYASLGIAALGLLGMVSKARRKATVA